MITMKEPSLEVAEYLKEARVNKIIVGHQPRGDAPLVIDLGTGIQVREKEGIKGQENKGKGREGRMEGMKERKDKIR